MLNKFQNSFHIPGTLAANLTITLTVPSDCSLVHVSAVASNNSDATLKIGTSADDDGYLTATAIGDSGTPAEFDLDDFDGALLSNPGMEYPHLLDGTVLVLTLDYDGAAGTAAQNVTLVATFCEG
jgi:hypothetical protein